MVRFWGKKEQKYIHQVKCVNGSDALDISHMYELNTVQVRTEYQGESVLCWFLDHSAC